MNICFHNNFHKGDCFLSREYVKDIMSKIKADEYTYYHNFDNLIFKDIPNLKSSRNLDFQYRFLEISVINIEDKTLINTWIGQNNRIYSDRGCNLFSIYEMNKAIYNRLNIKLEDINYYIPSVDFSYVEKTNIDKFLDNHKDKLKVLISNGETLSGQALNFDFNSIVLYLSTMFKDVIFILTDNSNKIIKDNIFYSSDITESKSDMLELSYLSTFCDIIVGRTSGPYTFSYIKENMNNKDKTFICFCNLDILIPYKNNIHKLVWSNNYDINNILNIIINEIKNK